MEFMVYGNLRRILNLKLSMNVIQFIMSNILNGLEALQLKSKINIHPLIHPLNIFHTQR